MDIDRYDAVEGAGLDGNAEVRIRGSSTGDFVYYDDIELIIKERDEALEKLAAMESQEPVFHVVFDGYKSHSKWVGIDFPRNDEMKLYRKPVPADKPAVAVPDGYIAVDVGLLEDIKCDLERLQDDCLTNFNVDSQQAALKHVKTRLEEISGTVGVVISPIGREVVCTYCGFSGSGTEHKEKGCPYVTYPLAAAPSHSQQREVSNWISEEANKAVETTKDWPQWRKDAITSRIGNRCPSRDIVGEIE